MWVVGRRRLDGGEQSTPVRKTQFSQCSGKRKHSSSSEAETAPAKLTLSEPHAAEQEPPFALKSVAPTECRRLPFRCLSFISA